MTNTTIGQRIAERRKLLGISQEALGEKLGVSRQAISKWESDSAIPEIDKLIALSRLFSVSVGWLLGTEDAPGCDSADTLSEGQLKTIQDLLGHYLAPAKTRRFWAALLCLAAMVSIVLLAVQLFNTQKTMENYQWQLSRLQSDCLSLHGELNDLSSQLELVGGSPETSSLLSDYSWEVLSMNGSDHGRVFFTLIPKNRQESDAAVVTARRDGQIVASEPCAWDGSAYTTRLVLPPENGYEFYFTITRTVLDESGQLAQKQELQRLQCPEPEQLKRQLAITCGINFEESQYAHRSGDVILRNIAVSVGMPEALTSDQLPQLNWQVRDFVLYKNGQEIDRVSPPELLSQADASMEFHASVEQIQLHSGQLAEGDVVEIWLETELSNGYTGRANVCGWMCQDGDIVKYAVAEAD